MTDSEITTTILRQIRDEIIATRTELGSRIEATNVRLDATNERLDLMNDRIDVTNDRLSIVETVVRDAAQQISTVVDHVKMTHNTAIDDLRKRVTKLEKKVG